MKKFGLEFQLDKQDVGVDSGQIVFMPFYSEIVHFSYPPVFLDTESDTLFEVYIKRNKENRPEWFVITTECENFKKFEHVGSFRCETDRMIAVDPCYINFTEDDNYTEPIFKEFYDKVCAITLGERPFDVFKHDGMVGAASSTAWGDGGYNCYYRKDDNGNVMTAMVHMA